MIYRLLASAGFFAVGFLLGREIGRTEAIRQHLGSGGRFRKGETFESDDYIVLDEKNAAGSPSAGPARAEKEESRNG